MKVIHVKHMDKETLATALLAVFGDKLLDVIKRKQKGETVQVEQPGEAEEETPDLMEALRASIEARAGAKRRTTKRSSRRGSSRRGGTRARSGR